MCMVCAIYWSCLVSEFGLLRSLICLLESSLFPITELILAMMQPSKLAIKKCQAHRKGDDKITKGNNAANETAKMASKRQTCILAPLASLEPVMTPEDIILQKANKKQASVSTVSESGEG